MKEYISKEYINNLLEYHLDHWHGPEYYTCSVIQDEINDAPAYVKKEIIECRYCKWFDPDENIMPESGRCGFHEMVKMFDDFCSRGKRNEE